MQKMSCRARNLVVILCSLMIFQLLTLLSLGMDLGRQKAENSPSPSKFLKAMDFTLPDLSGENVSLSEFENKKVVLLTFWRTGCDYCLQEIPILKEIYAKYNDKGVEILAVNVRESGERLNRFKERENIAYRILIDSERKVGRLYQVIGVPLDVIIDRGGRVRYYDFGWPDNLEEIIEGLLSENKK